MAEPQVQEAAQQRCQCDCRRTMTRSSRAGELGWRRRCSTVAHQMLVVIFAVAAEFERANAAMERYEQLRVAMRARCDPNASPARRVYVEFYADL
jgi:hypothetical protein